jgi:uncharacterized protein YdiU (UPF0061 family)
MKPMPNTEILTAPDGMRFDNAFVRDLPGDPEERNFRRQVHRAAYSKVLPTPVRAPKLIAHSREMCSELGLADATAWEAAFAEVFAGNRLLPGMEPFAMCYGGHQFGNWAGQLGDGRAINLGETIGPRGGRWALQLKGAGPTPYSRTADGLAVLRSSLREFICSEAMHHLGVPTTRALSLVSTGEPVVRDMFYDGNPRAEPGAIVCRVAPSFVRFGNFEIFTSRGDVETLRRLADHTIRTVFPHLVPEATGEIDAEVYLRWFDEVCRATASMLVHWMRVGFVHGVMNTDNMSILGLTIDYGPYGWVEDYDPNWTPNTTDAQGRRYCFGNQPRIALWNLLQLANAIVPLVGITEPLEASLQGYSRAFESGWQNMMASKLGLDRYQDSPDDGLIDGLLQFFALTETDMTLFFRGLAELETETGDAVTSGPVPGSLIEAFYHPEQVVGPVEASLVRWLGDYRLRLRATGIPDALRRSNMNRVNPLYVPRNYLAQLAIDAAEQGDPELTRQWLDVLRTPYTETVGGERFAAKRPEWARDRAGCSMLSCSS